mmetsp:Transcript_9122/g.21867  ORF Transcript_9122/g.21867 Transcript_9122/m.21867 type:complete len:146 (+) Transcript_9122:62-499(+)
MRFLTAILVTLCLAAKIPGQADEDEFEDLRIIRIMAPACKQQAAKGDKVTLHYSGWLKDNYPDGKMFDSTKNRNKAFQMTLGTGKMIKGFVHGILEMCPGEKRLLEIPPHLGYGKKGAGKVIPPDSTLVFEVELLSIDEKAKQEL